MKSVIKAVLCGVVAAGSAGAALAGEDSTHLWNGVGPAYYQTKGGLRRFAECGGQDAPHASSPECKHVQVARKDSSGNG